MARIYGLNGILRGRQGNNVFSVQNGTQVLKQYQPAVSNPRTDAQQTQRSKFALAGKISGVTPALAIVGMPAGNERDRRALFVRNLIAAMTTSNAAGNITAAVAYDKMLFAIGALPQYTNGVPSVTAAFGGSENYSRVNVTVPAIGSLAAGAPDGYGEMCVVGLFDAATSNLDEVQAFVRTSSNQTLSFRQGARRNCYVVTWIIPFAPNTARGAANAGLLDGGETAVSSLLSSSSFLSGMDWGTSIYVSNIPVLGATTSMAPSPNDDMRSVVEEGLMETAVAEGKRKK